MVGAAGTAGAAAAAELQATHRRHWWRTGAGGVTGYTVAALVEDWRRRAAAPVEDSRRTSREPAAGVMDWRRSGQRSDSESQSLHTAGLGQPAGQRHSPAPTGVRRGTSDGNGWIGSKAVEITGSRVGRAVLVACDHYHFRGVCILPGRQIPDGCKHSQFQWNYHHSGRHPVTGVFISAVGALVITPRGRSPLLRIEP